MKIISKDFYTGIKNPIINIQRIPHREFKNNNWKPSISNLYISWMTNGRIASRKVEAKNGISLCSQMSRREEEEEEEVKEEENDKEEEEEEKGGENWKL